MAEPHETASALHFATLARALKSELEQIEKLPHNVTLQRGQFVQTFASQHYYRFEIPENVFLRGIDRVVMTFGRAEPVDVPCNIISLENQFLTVALPIDVGPTIPEVQCSWSYAERFQPIIDTLNTLREHEGLPWQLFHPSEPANRTTPLFEPQTPPDTPQNQRDALANVLQNRVSIIWGPILSGKTRLHALIAANFVKAGKKVLFVAPTTERVDATLHRAVEVGAQVGVDMLARTSRVGLPLAFDTEDMVKMSFDHQVESMKKELFQERVSLVEQHWRVKIKRILHEDYYAALEALRDRTAEAKAQYDRVTAELNTAREKLTKLQNASMLEKMKKSYKDDLAQTQKLVADRQAHQKRYQTMAATLAAELPKMEAQAPIKAAELKEQEQTSKRIEDLGGLEKILGPIEQTGLLKESEALKGKDFIGTTVMTALADERLKDMTFDLVIVDDAEVVNLPTFAALATRAKERIVVSGDPFQVDPESFTNTDLAQEWLQRDIFMYAAGTEELNRLFTWSEQNPQWSIFLSSQYATTPKLSTFVASVLFDDKLNVIVSPTAKGKVYFFDTTLLKSTCRQYGGKKKILPFNDTQAKLAVECVKHALIEGGRTAAEVGIVTPVPGQTLYLKLLLRMEGIRNVEVGTPQTFRERRKKAIIFDTTMAGVDYTLRPMDDKKVGEQRIASMLNTVFSCVAEDLYVLADMSHFNTMYKDRLFTKLLMLLQAQSDGQPGTGKAAKRFEELEWHEREPLYALAAKGPGTKAKPAEAAMPMDAELELRMKMLAKQQRPMLAGQTRNYEREIYQQVHRILGRRADLNLLSQFIGGPVLFHQNLAAEQAVERLPIDFCQNEKDFREIVEKWNLVIYEMSGGKKSDASFFKQAPETRVRWDLYNIKAFYSFDIDAVVEEGKQKLAMAVSKMFQETFGKPQPSSPAEWAEGYLSMLTKLESYLTWITEQVRK
jgi:KaiC/GvpD/RAD55 family RecA-like ATPase